jgi:Uma2 family endonuclease
MQHQRISARLFLLLTEWGARHQLEVFYAPAAITFTTRRELQPDLFLVPFVDGRRIQEEQQYTQLVLAIEVLSPSTARYDRVTKRRVFLEQGVAEYWIVDPDGRTVERWRQGEERPEILDEHLRWTPPGISATLDIDLVELFRTGARLRSRSRWSVHSSAAPPGRALDCASVPERLLTSARDGQRPGQRA